MPEVRLVRVHNRHLSLWQSAVAENARERLGGEPSAWEVLAHPLMIAVNDHVEAVMAGGREAQLQPDSTDERRTAAYLSQLGFEKGLALAEGDTERAAALDVEFRKFSDKDPGFLTCATTYAAYFAKYKGVFKYNDWTREGGNNPEYGVIGWRLPNNAVVGVIGDWGTGMQDAEQLLRELMVRFKPAALIHLGDIYYSATPEECLIRYANVITKVFDEVLGPGNRIPVFTLAGNHDYYAAGYGFYEMFNAINARIPGAQQPASYFCLRTADNWWQFLGMDTGFYDANPADQIDPFYAGPWLHPSEVVWLQHKLNTFPGATVLLSHHQLFSAHAKLNGMESAYRDLPFLNPFLRAAFGRYFASNVAAWLWGHEHNFAAYRNGLFGLAKGRLIGCSAYEELTSSEPYKVTYPQVPYLDPDGYRLSASAGYYNHGYGVIDLGSRVHPGDPVAITYYQYPSWGAAAPPTPTSQAILTEQLQRPVPPAPQPVSYGAPLRLLAREGLYIGPMYASIEYYPRMSANQPVALTIQGGSGVIRHGQAVQIKTTEPGAAAYNLLGAWSTPALYYYTPSGDNQLWEVRKRDPSTPEVRYGDEVCFVNRHYGGQYLQPYWSAAWEMIYLTTRPGEPYYWTAQPNVGAAEEELGKRAQPEPLLL